MAMDGIGINQRRMNAETNQLSASNTRNGECAVTLRNLLQHDDWDLARGVALILGEPRHYRCHCPTN
jgi:hypothetical protein